MHEISLLGVQFVCQKENIKPFLLDRPFIFSIKML